VKSHLFEVLISVLLLPPASAAAISSRAVVQLKPCVVNIQRFSVVGVNAEGRGNLQASGFIVDAKRGIIATNRHVAGTSPSRFKIIFENGQSTDAKLLHYDAWHDFAFLSVDPSALKFPLKAAVLGDSYALKEQDDVFMIGNNDAFEYSVKYGKIANLVLTAGGWHSAIIQTTFDRAGGSSGSPVFNDKGLVVGIHFGGSETTSLELRIEYIKDALRQLQEGSKIERGDAGVGLGLMFVSDVQKHFHLPEDVAKRVLGLRKDLKYMTVVHFRVPGSVAAEKLLPGDQILTIDGHWIGDDLYRFDRMVDAKVGERITLRIARAGKEFTVELPVQNAETLKIHKFVRFAGGVLQDPTPELRLLFNVSAGGVIMTQADVGSSMLELGRVRDRLGVLIQNVNGIPTPDLEAFIKAVRPLKDHEPIYFIVDDKSDQKSDLRAEPVILNLKFSPLEVYNWSPEKLEWTKSDGS
jgi:S1-C subfamily serine protease